MTFAENILKQKKDEDLKKRELFSFLKHQWKSDIKVSFINRNNIYYIISAIYYELNYI